MLLDDPEWSDLIERDEFVVIASTRNPIRIIFGH